MPVGDARYRLLQSTQPLYGQLLYSQRKRRSAMRIGFDLPAGASAPPEPRAAGEGSPRGDRPAR